MRSNMYKPFIHKIGGVWYWRPAMYRNNESNREISQRNIAAMDFCARLNGDEDWQRRYANIGRHG